MFECCHLPVHLACSTELPFTPFMLAAQARWRQLRSCAGTLESIIWEYRTRVAPFGVLWNNAEQDWAERELRASLINWREKLAAGADLNTSTLRRNFPPRVFKHGQRPPPAVSLMQRCWHRVLLNRWWERHNKSRNTVRVRGRVRRVSKLLTVLSSFRYH